MPSRIDIPNEGIVTFDDIRDELQNVYDRAEQYINDQAGTVAVDDLDLKDCMGVL